MASMARGGGPLWGQEFNQHPNAILAEEFFDVYLS